MKLTVIADNRRLVADLSPEKIVKAAAILKQHAEVLAYNHLTVLLEGDDGITHIVCRRPPLKNS